MNLNLQTSDKKNDNTEEKRHNTVVSSLIDASGSLNRQRNKFNRVIVSLVALGSVAGLLAFSFTRTTPTDAPVAVIQPETTFTRIKPADSEGMDIPNKDKLVYSQINSAGGETTAQIENIAPVPERPLNRLPEVVQDQEPTTVLKAGGALKPNSVLGHTAAKPQSEQAVKLANPVSRTANENYEELQELPVISNSQTVKVLGNVTGTVPVKREQATAVKKPAATEKTQAATKTAAPIAKESAINAKAKTDTKPAANSAITDAKTIKTAAVVPAKTAPIKPAAKESSVTAASLPVAVTKGSFRIQLAAVRTEALAGDTWTKIRASNSAALGKAQKYVEPVKAGDKNTLYRLQAGSWSTRDDASKVCAALKASGTSCLVVAK